jgi:hypothetical protein
MQQEHDLIKEEIVRNKIGLRKTLQMITHCIIEANFAQCVAEINTFQEADNSTHHLHPHTSKRPQTLNTRCPSGLKFSM